MAGYINVKDEIQYYYAVNLILSYDEKERHLTSFVNIPLQEGDEIVVEYWESYDG